MRNQVPGSSSAILDTIYIGCKLESYLMSYCLFLCQHISGNSLHHIEDRMYSLHDREARFLALNQMQ
jgi:hypothetical protein